MERVVPRAMDYDEVLPLAIESRSNRRTFLPVNGQSFSNTNGSTIIRIDVNADSMLDPTHSYLTLDLHNDAAATNFLSPEIGVPMIQRLRIESGGVTIEDINEYGKLYAMMLLHQCPPDYIKNVCGNQGMYPTNQHSGLQDITLGAGTAAANTMPRPSQGLGNLASQGHNPNSSEVSYLENIQSWVAGVTDTGAMAADAAANRPNALSILVEGSTGSIPSAGHRTYTIPLLSGLLNQDKYLPLIMMNAGFTIEIHLAPANAVGINQVQTAAAAGAYGSPVWSVKNCKYVANLIDLDREFYGKLRGVMEAGGGVLQLAGQTYRHYSGQVAAGGSEYSLSLPARVKSIKSIFAVPIDSTHRLGRDNYSVSVGQTANISSWRFEIGSVRYPQTDINVEVSAVRGHPTGTQSEVVSELHKAFGRLGDYNHSSSAFPASLTNAEQICDNSAELSRLSAFMIGYDFEAFQKVALESGINTADRSLPINFIFTKGGISSANAAGTANPTHLDFYVLSDAIYYINLDGTVSVSV